MKQTEELLKMDRVTKSYPMPDGPAVEVLREVTLGVKAGESVAIVGPSGSGKSTLLNIAGTLDAATSGSVRLLGRDLAGLDERELAGLRSGQIGFVFQQHHLLPQCTVLENVLLPALAGGGRVHSRTYAKARALLGRVGLGGREGHLPGQLSGGESQRAAMVRALINDPAILLADEPTGSLDEQTGDAIFGLLKELAARSGVAVVLATHERRFAEACDRIVRVRDGRLSEV